MSTTDIDAILSQGNSRRRWLLLAGAAVVIAVVAVVVALLTRPDDEDVSFEPERVEAAMGRLSTRVDLSGSALSERSATLGFEVSGVVASVAVSEGNEVREGDPLASLDDAEAQRRVRTAEVQLDLAQLRLEDLLAEPEPAAIASANQAIVSAKSQVVTAQQALDLLSEPPSAADLSSAEQAVASALRELSSAEQALEELAEPPSAADLASSKQAVASALREVSSAEQALEELAGPPSAADLASAEQAVASALRELSSAEQALALLSEPPGASDLRSAEQAVATALRDISSSEQALNDLTAGPTDAEVSESRSAVMQAQVALVDATRIEEELNEVLTDASEEFCERHSGLIPSDGVIRSTCETVLPLSEAQIEVLEESFEDRSATYENLATALINANLAFVSAHADRDSALSYLASAEETLDEMLTPPSAEDLFQAEQAVEAAKASHASAEARLEDLQALASDEDVYQAEQAVEAAKASHAAAEARLEDLQTLASDEDVYQAEQAVEAAKASHTAAVARLEDLKTLAGDEDVYQAEQAVEAAKASHSAAEARLEELRAATDEGELEKARAALESAQASLASAQAQYDELVAGASENAIAQQRQDVRLAEISLEEAHAALADLTVFAPFDGVVEAVNILPGDRIAAGFDAFTLYTSDRMLIELTVTEEELLELEIGQTGSASFDAIEGTEYPVRVESIRRVPNAEQGVVTYDVGARILTGNGGDAVLGAARANARGGGSGGFGGGGFAGGFGGGQGGGPFAGFELPEGVTPEQVRQAIISGEPLPEGVELPEQVQQMIENLRASGRLPPVARGQQASDSQPGTEEQTSGSPDLPLPAPGMSASVTILTEIREPALLVPVSAVRQLEGQWFVSVHAPSELEGETGFERAYVEVGESDGNQVEILSGIEAGTILLVGADNAGIAFSATLQQPQANPGFGGFGPGGGGGRR